MRVNGVRSTTDWLQNPAAAAADMQRVRSMVCAALQIGCRNQQQQQICKECAARSTQHSRRRLRLCGIIIPFIKGQLQVVCCLANIEHANLAAKLLVRAWPSWFAAIAVALAKVVCFPHQIFRDPRTLCLFDCRYFLVRMWCEWKASRASFQRRMIEGRCYFG